MLYFTPKTEIREVSQPPIDIFPKRGKVAYITQILDIDDSLCYMPFTLKYFK
jgi:hypothetical protein